MYSSEELDDIVDNFLVDPSSPSVSETDGDHDKTEQTTDSSETAENRFVKVTDSMIDGYVQKQSNKRTLSKTYYDNRLLQKFLDAENETRPIQEIPPNQLCAVLCKFFISVRKSDGTNYEPNSLRAFMCSFDRKLRNLGYEWSLVHGNEFAKLRNVVKTKVRELKTFGKGNLPRTSKPITDEEIEILWQHNQFGNHTPNSIINTLWFNNTIHFGLRGSDEHRNMSWGDVKLCEDCTGLEYLEFVKRRPKTRPGENPGAMQAVKQKMSSYMSIPDRCPVNTFKLYASKRPTDYCNPEDPFYIASTHTNQNNLGPNGQWFKRQPIGINKLNGLMKTMVKAAGLPEDKKLSNRSARKHHEQKLGVNNSPPTQIMQITGHHNLQSVNNYNQINEVQHNQISQVLSSPSPITKLPRILPKPPSTHSPVQNAATKSQSVLNLQGRFHTLLAGANISGGTFNIHSHQVPSATSQLREATGDKPLKNSDSS